MSKKKVKHIHHIIYGSDGHPEQEWKVPVWAGEHLTYSRMTWYTRKEVSKGLIRSLEFFILRNKDRAVEIKE